MDSELRKHLDKMGLKQREAVTFHAKLGDGNGALQHQNPDGNNQSGHIWALIQMGDEASVTPRIVRNRVVAEVYGLPVLISYGIDGILEVVGEDVTVTEHMMGEYGGSLVARHAWTHSQHGPDPDFVDGMRVLPGLVMPTDNAPDLYVTVRPFFYRYNSTDYYYPGESVDLSSYVPASEDEQVAVIVCFDPDNNRATVHAGDAAVPYVVDPEAIPYTESDVAAIDCAGDMRFAAIRLYYGQATITRNDWIADMRTLMAGDLGTGVSVPQNYFLTDTASDIAGYLSMPATIGGGESSVAVSVTAADTPIQEWATPSGFPALSFLSGIVHFHVHAEKTSGTKTVQFYAELYQRDSGDVETLLSTSENTSDVPSDPTAIEVDFFVDDVSLATDDRLVLKVLATPAGGGTNPELTLYMEGTTNSRISIPVAAGHLDAGQVTFTPAVLADWTGSTDPGNTGPALDQLAERVTDIEEAPGSTVAAYEDGVEVVAAADKFDFKDANVEDAGSNDAAIYLDLPHIFQARLTLESGVPVSTSAQTAKTTVYLTPYHGNKISLYDGTRWKLHSLAEIDIALTDVQTGDTTNTSAVITDLTDTSQLIAGMEVTGVGIPANTVIASVDSATQVTLDQVATADGNDVSLTFKVPAGTVLDIFVYQDSGTPKLEMVAWTDGSTRATAITTQDGVAAKTGDTTRRLAGSVCTTATAGQTEVSSSFCGISNVVNRVRYRLYCVEPTNTWTYSTAAWRAANNDTTLGVNRVGFVDALGDVFVRATNVAMAAHSTGFQPGSGGVGINSTSTNSAYLHGQIFNQLNRLFSRGIYAGYVGAGYTFIQRLEIASGVNTTTWVGDAGYPELKTGMEVIIEY